MSWKGQYYDDSVNVFYTNLKLLDTGDLVTEVLKKKIWIAPDDWINVVNLKNEGRKFDLSAIHDDLNYDNDHALDEMLRPQLHGCPSKNVGCLIIEDILLHNIYVHILSPRDNNYAQLL